MRNLQPFSGYATSAPAMQKRQNEMIKFQKLNDAAQLPFYATEGAAGADISACIPDDRPLFIPSGEYRLIGTGISCSIAPGFELQVRPRSGLAAKHGVTVLNSPGTIDSDYIDQEIKVCLINHGAAPFLVKHGDRIAQLVGSAVVPMSIPTGGKRTGGFGSTGK